MSLLQRGLYIREILMYLTKIGSFHVALLYPYCLSMGLCIADVMLVGREGLRTAVAAGRCGVTLLTHLRPMSDNQQLPVLTLFTKDNCPLCDEALEVLKPYRNTYRLEKVDITKPENKKWMKMYKYDIPVFHLEGKFLMKHRADVAKLRTALLDISCGET